MLRLSESLNKSKVQHMIFTLDGNTFKSFGDELSMKVLRQNGEVGKKIEEILRESEQLKRVEEAKNPDGEENVSTAYDVRLVKLNSGNHSSGFNRTFNRNVERCVLNIWDELNVM